MSSSLTWSPPEKPDLRKILHEAYADTEAGQFENALQKLLWFHENANKIDFFRRCTFKYRPGFLASVVTEVPCLFQ
ncbi:MAG: hypothetical protein R3C11_22605 [Planctomycetaceae bacterium]